MPEMTSKKFTAMKSTTFGDDRSKLWHFVTTAASCERRTPSFTIAVINKVTQEQEIFLFSKKLKTSPEPAKAPI
jgi:hypothetical protein